MIMNNKDLERILDKVLEEHKEAFEKLAKGYDCDDTDNCEESENREMADSSFIMARWKEFNPNAEKSMREDFKDSPSPNRQRIMDYLNKGEVKLVATSREVDVISGEKLDQTKCILTDGEYTWSGSLGYYIQKYNLQIPKEFEDKILNM